MIIIGEVTVNADRTATITPPAGWNRVTAVRLSNYTPDAIILTNITGTSQSQEYLFPFTVMVYHTQNVSKVPTLTGISLGSRFETAQLFVEWSDDPDNDFIGTYPMPMIVAPLSASGASAFAWDNGFAAVPGANTTFSIPADESRRTLVIKNTGLSPIEYSPVNAAWGTHPSIEPGGVRELATVAVLYFRQITAPACADGIQWWSTNRV